MGNRITGLSGMDIESMVSSLMKVETQKVDKLYKQRTMLQWKQEAYKTAASSLTTFQSKFLDILNPALSLKTKGFFTLKNFKISSNSGDSKAITVKNKSFDKNVDHKVIVHELAQAQKMTGTPGSAEGYTKKIVSSDIDVDSLSENMTLELNLDGKKIKADLSGLDAAFANIDSDTGITDKKAAKLEWVANKLDAQFADFGKSSNVKKRDENGNEVTDGNGVVMDNKVNVRATSDGKLVFETEAGRSLSVSSFNNQYKASAQFAYKPEDTNDVLSFNIDGSNGKQYSISVDTYAKNEGGSYVIDDDTGEKVKLKAEQLAEEINKALKEAKNTTAVADLVEDFPENDIIVSASGGDIKFTAKSDSVSYTITETTVGDADKMLTDGNAFEIYGKTASEFGVAAGASTDSTSTMTVESMFGSVNFDNVKIAGKSLTDLGIDGDTTISQLITKVNDEKLGLKLDFNSLNGSFTMESTSTGAANGFKLSDEAMAMFGFDTGTVIEAKDARFEVDGIMTTRESNNISVGNLNVTLNEVTAGTANEVITIKSESDTDTIVNNIKEFINDYNSLLASLTKSYTETRAKSGSYSYYDPLSDEERAAMSEKDVELWDEKAKQGILSRDPALGRIIDQMRSAMSSPVTLDDGRKMYLSDIGIASTDWKDMGALTVDEDKLRKALEERPEDVEALFNKESSVGYYGDRSKRSPENGLAYRLDDVIRDATRTNVHTTNKTYGSLVELAGSKNTRISDNEMAKKLKEINQRILDLEALNLSKENSYYNMFSKMESAMTKAQNQMSMAGLG